MTWSRPGNSRTRAEEREAEDDGDDGLECWDTHDLPVATLRLREQRLLVVACQRAVRNGSARHDIRRLDNRGSPLRGLRLGLQSQRGSAI